MFGKLVPLSSSVSRPGCRIFVAGIASKGSVNHLFSYFEKFGPVRGIEVFPGKGIRFLSPGEEWHPRHPLKGYCVVHMENPEDASFIISQSPHCLGERVLSCKPYLRGEELRKLNQTLCHKRLILKQVPKGIDLEPLKRQLEALAGPIESFYVLVTDRDTALERRHSTCSVLFKSETARQILLNLGSIPGPHGKHIYFRAYEQKNTLQINSSKGPKGSKNDSIKTMSNTPISLRMTKESASRSHFEKSFAKYSAPRRYLSESSRDPAEIGGSAVDADSLDSNFHSLKPNKAKYFVVRGLVDGFPGSSRNHTSEICFNISTPRAF